MRVSDCLHCLRLRNPENPSIFIGSVDTMGGFRGCASGPRARYYRAKAVFLPYFTKPCETVLLNKLKGDTMANALPTHAQLMRKRSRAGVARQRRLYDTRAWKAARRRFLAANPLCADCAARGITELATDVDHITPYRRGGDTFAPENLRPLCHRCHSRKTVLHDGGFGRGDRGAKI